MGENKYIDKQLRGFKNQLPVYNYLSSILQDDGKSADGSHQYWKYPENINDTTVGQQFGFTATQIANFRQEQGWILRPPGNRKKRSRVREVQKNLDQLAALVLAYHEKYTETAKEVETLKSEAERLAKVVDAQSRAILTIEEIMKRRPEWTKLGDLRSTTPVRG